MTKATPAEIEQVVAEAHERCVRRALARQERGLPLTHSVLNKLARDEARRAADRFIASKPN
jgi:hypothetical protein